MSLHIRRLTHDVACTQDALSDLKKAVNMNQGQTTIVVDAFKKDIEQFKRQALNACREGMLKNSETTFATLHESISTLKTEMETMKAMMLQSASDHSHEEQ